MFNISKYMPQINAYCFRSMNKARVFLYLKPKSDYKLISKINSVDISKLNKDKHWNIPSDAVNFDYIVLGKKSDPEFSREVLSCFNENGDVISRCYRDNGINTKRRLYSYEPDKRIIKSQVYDTSRVLEESWRVPNILNMCGRWNLIFTELQNIRHLNGFFRKGKTPTLMTTKRVEPLTEDSKRYTFRQFPINLGFDKKPNKRVFSAVLTRTKEGINLSDMKQSENLHLDFSDKFLLARILNPHSEEGLTELTKSFLKERGLDSFNIGIVPNCPKVSQNSDAYFSNMNKEICYRTGLTKEYVLSIVDTVRHEIEHAWQHFMIGRIGKGKSQFETEALQKFGQPKNPEDTAEAVKLAVARDNYPRLSDTEDLSKNIEYQTNYMEVKAREAGNKASKEYTQPKDNFIYFEQFN